MAIRAVSAPQHQVRLGAPALYLGTALQVSATYLGFQHPGWFWRALPPGLSSLGIPGLRRLRSRPQPASPGWLVLGLLAGVAGYGVTALGAALVARSAIGRRSLARIHECSASVGRPTAALLTLPASLGEELFWRESVLRAHGRADREPVLADLASTTLLYAAVQSASLEPLPPLGALLLGGGAGWLRIRSRSIWPAVLAHLVYSELCLVAPGLTHPRPSAIR